jgi:hypothetical protein
MLILDFMTALEVCLILKEPHKNTMHIHAFGDNIP